MTSPRAALRMPAGVWALGFVSLLMDVSSELIHSLLPVFMLTALGISATAIGFIEGAAEATALVVKVFSGTLSDYWGRRKPLALFGYGLSAASKPLFALASGAGLLVAARLIDRVGKGVRGAPRDALIADIVAIEMRGAAFGLRQALDTVGAFLGPLLAMLMMWATADDFRAAFWVAAIPALLAVGLLAAGVREPERPPSATRVNPLRRENLARLPAAYWAVVGFAGLFTLARFSEAFLVLRAQQGGLALALTPAVLIAMNVVYSLSAYPFGRLADAMRHETLLALGLVLLLAADAAFAWSADWRWTGLGIVLWGLHMGMTQGLLSTMVAAAAPADLRGTAFGCFNLVAGAASLAASVIAGLVWDRYGAANTFAVGGGTVVLALAALALAARRRSRRGCETIAPRG